MRPKTCPICRKQLPVLDVDAPFRPFCSPRCKSIDLGSWLEGSYRVSRPLEAQDLDAGPPLAVESERDDGARGRPRKR